MKSITKLISCLFISMINAVRFMSLDEVREIARYAYQLGSGNEFLGKKYGLHDGALLIDQELCLWSRDGQQRLLVYSRLFKDNVLYLVDVDVDNCRIRSMFAMPIEVVDGEFKVYVWDGGAYVLDERTAEQKAVLELFNIIQGIFFVNNNPLPRNDSLLEMQISPPLRRGLDGWRITEDMYHITAHRTSNPNRLYRLDKKSCTLEITDRYGKILIEYLKDGKTSIREWDPVTAQYRLAKSQACLVPPEVMRLAFVFEAPQTSPGPERRNRRNVHVDAIHLRDTGLDAIGRYHALEAIHARNVRFDTTENIEAKVREIINTAPEIEYSGMKCYVRDHNEMVIVSLPRIMLYRAGAFYIASIIQITPNMQFYVDFAKLDAEGAIWMKRKNEEYIPSPQIYNNTLVLPFMRKVEPVMAQLREMIVPVPSSPLELTAASSSSDALIRFRPPGLNLPIGFRPPPGLSLESEFIPQN